MVHLLDLAWLSPICISPIAGSLAGVLVRRLPRGRSVGWVRSQCESCRRTLSFTDLVPIVSYLLLRGHCATCRAKIAPFHLAIEVAAVAVAVSAALVNRDAAWLWTACSLGWTLLALAWIDFKHMRLPDALTLPLVAAGIASQTMLNPERFPECTLGAIIGYLSLQAVALTYRLIRRRDGLGAGDAKLLSAAGAWVGWASLPNVVFLAALLGLGLIATLHFRWGKNERDAIIPFGPCIALALWTTYLHGPFCLVRCYEAQ